MGKGKGRGKQQVINNIAEMNLNIDPDELAAAIVRAQEMAEAKANEKKKFTSKAIAGLVAAAFYGMTVVGVMFCVAIPVAVIDMFQTFRWTNIVDVLSQFATIICMAVLEINFAVYTVCLWNSAKEVAKEKDRNYIVSLFSSVVSFAALIVALVALFKGVG